MKKTNFFVVGDKVEYSKNFLRSISWFTNVPKRGTVVEAETPAYGCQIVSVKFDIDYDTPDSRRINSFNLIKASDASKEPR